jgi:hypothetical protein
VAVALPASASGRRRVARRIAALLAVALLPALAGCESPRAACQKENPGNPAGFDSCWQAVLQRQNQRLNREDIREFRARGGG